jgi:hypothetical protein
MNWSTILFPLRSNASALFAGPGVAGVRRRILAAALLNDRVVLEDGAYIAWAGPTGGAAVMMHGEQSVAWQTPRQRGRATGAQHHVGARLSTAPESAPFRAMVVSVADFSWRATFEPFRKELPASATKWLAFGHVDDESQVSRVVRGWEDADRLYRLVHRLPSTASQFVESSIVKAGYFDLGAGASARVAVSMDRRHALAVQRRLEAGDAMRLGGHYALEVLLPTDFGWSDVPDLRKHRAIRDYRAIIREVEAAAIDAGTSIRDIDERIRREYQDRLLAASAKGLPFRGRVTLTAIGFVVGVAADLAAPFVGGATVATAAFVAGEVLDRTLEPRWLTVDRRLRGRRNGL